MADDLQLQAEEVVAFLREVDATIYKETVGAIRDLGKRARDLARGHAVEQGFAPPGTSGRGTGRLIESLSYTTKGATAILRETAKRGDHYSYPAVFEFGHSTKWGHRPFMVPAIHDIQPIAKNWIEDAIQHGLDELQHS